MKAPRLALLLLLAAAPLLARQRAVGRTVPVEPPVPAGTPTFSNEVVRIFQQHCQTCHRPNNVAPFSLLTYGEAKPYAASIKIMTMTHEMPPWKPADGCGDFEGRRGLSTSEIDTIKKWVDAGAPEGNRTQLPAPLSFTDGWTNGTPDLVLKMPEAFTAPVGQDTYRCFPVPTNLTASQYISAIETRPGDAETVHHVITFVDTTGASQKLDDDEPGAGYTCFGGPGFDTTATLGGWAPGSPPLTLPENVGFELPAGSRVVMQVHYHPHGAASEPDQTQLGLYFSKTKPKQLMRILPIINQSFTIPPNDANYKVSAEWPITVPFPMHLWLIAPHMHLLGRKMKVQMTPRNGTPQCLIEIDDWDFHWQGAYNYKKPVEIPTGARLSLEAWYDNSSGNPLNPNDPPKPVSWGEQTTDEMCIAFLGVTFDGENLN